MKMLIWQGTKGNLWLTACEAMSFSPITHNEMNLAKNCESELGAYPFESSLEMTRALLENPAKHNQISDPETLIDNKCVFF